MMIFKLIFAYLLKVRDWLNNKVGSLNSRFEDENGKYYFADPKNLKKIALIVGGIVFFLILLTQTISEKFKVSGGADLFNKEVKPSNAVAGRSLLAEEDDPFKQLGRARNQYGEEGKYLNSMQLGETKLGGAPSQSLTGDDLTPSLAECRDLINQLKQGSKMSSAEQTRVTTCLDKNVTMMTQDELKMMKALNNPNVTDQEKELIRKVVNHQATPEEIAVVNALMSGDPKKVAEAQEAIRQGSDAISALGKSYNGSRMTPEETILANRVKEQAEKNGPGVLGGTTPEAVANLRGILPGESGANGGFAGGLSGANGKDGVNGTNTVGGVGPINRETTPEAIKDLSKLITQKEAELKQKEQETNEQQIRVAPIAQKLAKGEALTDEENRQLQKFAQMKTELEKLKKEQEERKKLFAKNVSAIQSGLSAAVGAVQQTLASGTYIEYEGEPFDCSKVPKLPVKKKVKAKKQNVVLDANGKKLTPEEVEFIKLERKKAYDLALARKQAGNSMAGENLGKLSTGIGGNIQNMNDLVIFKDNALKGCELTPDMKIPAVLDSQILVSDKGKGQMVRARILADVICPQTNKLYIPKGSIVTTTAKGFDADTGVIDMTFDRVMVGSGKIINISMGVGSADGTMGLKGEVRDTRGKYLLGAFITSFTSGILSYMSQQYISPYQQSANFNISAQGSALAGGSDVAQKLAQLEVSDLQNAAKIFYVPKGVPIILFPQ